ncbi:predicted protein [Naegleria gruberi]|uniref:Predicted protein n=1 Tax=Naegleria gruberi TaxID=5762 RepID=D2VJG8_NAEGR|nr:uncharacterized protein NAEGRDRAFT_69033 [Naegleria gruberi]EFC42943.1 predicted protein [Naegleria gruberi]|eukprot:XP_002675687.1 predicted protein [Naegleria gruberi strain NEG-M]
MSQHHEKRKAFMFVRYPEASGPKSIMKHLGSFFIFHYSYDISDLLKESFSLVVIPGGTAKKQAKDLGSEGLAIIKKFVSDGGSYLGICAGGYLACFSELKLLENVEFILPKKKSNFKGNIKVSLSKQTEDSMENSEATVYYQNGPVFNVGNDSNISILATIVESGEIEWPDMIGKPCVVYGRSGRGKVLLMGPHFETSKGTSQLFVTFANKLIDET